MNTIAPERVGLLLGGEETGYGVQNFFWTRGGHKRWMACVVFKEQKNI